VGKVSIGVAATGLVSYAYFSLASHALDAAAYGRISLLWSAVFVTVSILYRPVEQLLARSIADHEARSAPERRPLQVAGRVQVGFAAGFAVLALALRQPIEDGLFDGSATLFWIMVGTVLAYAGGYFARGVLAGRLRFGSYGSLLLLESGTRVCFAISVAVGIAAGESVVALGMAVGPAVSLAVVVAVAGSRRRRRGRDRPGSAGAGGGGPPLDATGSISATEPEMSLAHGAGYAGGVLVIMACEQTFLASGPLLLGATEPVAGAALAGFAFNALLIARAPLQLFQSVQASILPHLTRLRAGGHSNPFHRSVTVTLLAVCGFAALVMLALLAVGPEAMAVLFGDGFGYSRGGLVLMGAGMGLYLAAATLTQAALARGRVRGASARWVAAAAAFAVLLLVPDLDDRVLQVEVAFAGGALLLFALLVELYRRGESSGRV
jgi:O-antigen/teichoic acid export membrane protein